ncbi:MAG: cupin-like domain-containing protein [Burkholderiales bacterium]
MNTANKIGRGHFNVAREQADIPFSTFCERYFDTETPVVIEKAGADWPAGKVWTEKYVHDQLSRDPSAKSASLWYWIEKGTLEKDYETPRVVSGFAGRPDIFPRNELMRIWIHRRGNVSSWHYDANMVNVLTVQVIGQKEWFLVSPETPLDCYPFTNFAILDGNDEKIFRRSIYTKVILNAGDLLYVPPLWFHKVYSLGEENINLDWIFTKRETAVCTRTLTRELERYSIEDYFSRHRFRFVRNAFQFINSRIPGYLRWKWRYPEMIRTPLTPRRLGGVRRTLSEMAVLGKVLWHAQKIRPYIRNLRPPRRLEGR